jgi:HYD1 signature containing ADP-ribosyltransferase
MERPTSKFITRRLSHKAALTYLRTRSRFARTATGKPITAVSGPRTTLAIAEESAPAEIRSLYHYTNEAGKNGILESSELRPSLWRAGTKDVRYGNGQYLSDITPGMRTPAELSYDFLGIPFQGRRFTHFVEVDVSGLRVIEGRAGVFVIPNDVPLDLFERIISSGEVPRP